VRIAGNKIEALTEKLSSLRGNDKPEDDRIFPMHFAGVVIREGAQNLLVPARYHCRPVGKLASIDRQFPGLYNARRDNIDKFWRQQFGQSHALMVVESFYENVEGPDGKNQVLHFQPRPRAEMLIACLYSRWKDPKTGEELLSFAAVTDEPPAEVVAAGHDRMIVNLKREHVDAWLAPAGRSDADLQSILSDRDAPYYEHEVEAA
jgi:putative SOS response-associated peptidase YedK